MTKKLKKPKRVTCTYLLSLDRQRAPDKYAAPFHHGQTKGLYGGRW